MFSDADGSMAFFLQKPSPERIVALSEHHTASLDTGVWLLTERAVETLMRKCGWDPATETFEGGAVRPYELFDRFGLALGSAPAEPDPAAAAGIRAALTEAPPNGRARFVTPSVSSTGLQITRS